MNDNQVLKQVTDIVSIRWCAACNDQFVHYSGYDTILQNVPEWKKRTCCRTKVARDKLKREIEASKQDGTYYMKICENIMRRDLEDIYPSAPGNDVDDRCVDRSIYASQKSERSSKEGN